MEPVCLSPEVLQAKVKLVKHMTDLGRSYHQVNEDRALSEYSLKAVFGISLVFSVLGISLNLNPSVLPIAGPIMGLLLLVCLFFVVQWKILWDRSIANHNKVMPSINKLASTIQNIRASDSLAAVWDDEVKQHYKNLGKLLTQNNQTMN